MGKTTSNSGILIVTDVADEVHVLRGILTTDMGQYWCVESDEDGIRLFMQKRPALLILSYRDVTSAERFFLMLHRQCPDIHLLNYQCLVFCTNKDAEAAFKLCRDEVIDDYLVDRPLFDPFRLRLSIHQALELASLKQQSSALKCKLGDTGKDLRQLDDHMGRTLSTGRELQQESIRAFHAFTSKMSDDLAQFEAGLLESSITGTALAPDVLQQKLKKLPRAYLEMQELHISKKMHDAEILIKQIETDFKQQISALQKGDFPQSRPEIMVVDDEDIYRELILDVLEEAGFRTTGVESGKIALERIRLRCPDLILLDFQMPGLNGLETLRHIKAAPDSRKIAVIMLTGASDKTVVQECIKAGAVDFIVKPGDRDTIIAKINAHLPQQTGN